MCVGQCSKILLPDNSCRENCEAPALEQCKESCFNTTPPQYLEFNCHRCTDCDSTSTPLDPTECWKLEDKCCMSIDGCYTKIDSKQQNNRPKFSFVDQIKKKTKIQWNSNFF